jgi:tetratricopeptide (TPR) repeat protein
MDHGKRDVSSFPIATGTYYKVNYAPGTDISRCKNIPVPTSYMAYHSDFDFMGDYDYRAQAGMLHVANHHVVPGKKQWTWGNGDFGQAWDRQLTDEDGPYIELMCGAYTDNQPDFSWIAPGEEKSFTQVFMPYKQIGPASNANQDAALHLEVAKDTAHFGVYLSSPRKVTVRLTCQGSELYSRQAALDPENVLIDQAALPAGTRPQQVTLSVLEDAHELLSFTPLADVVPEIPAPASAARPPEEIASVEELYLHGLHLEQYRHATYAPEPYYLEALRRDPGDSRCNNAMGLLLYRRGKFAEAEVYFRKAIQRLTLRNPNPYDGEPFYNLGLALRMQERYEEAFAAFHKAIWNAAWQHAGYFELARLASRAGQLAQALEYTGRSLSRNAHHYRARHLRIALLRLTGQAEQARREIARSLELDPMEYGALWERSLLDGAPAFGEVARADPSLRIDLALDYVHAGLLPDAIRLLEPLAEKDTLAAYTLGWVYDQAGQAPEAGERFRRAAALPPDYVFPNRLEDVLVFETAQHTRPQDAHAPYFLGNFWYAHRRYDEAIACWERAAGLDPNFATVQRNLGLGYFNKRGDPERALASFERAFALNPADARVFFELDQLRKRLGWPSAQRLAALQQHPHLVDTRDDLTIERVTLLNLAGQPVEAHRRLMERAFHPWEGGEGKVTGQYVYSLVAQAQEKLASGDAQAAIELLNAAQVYPPNLGEGKLYGAQENNIFYFLGRAYEQLGQPGEAKEWFERAATGLSEPSSAMYYNDQPPDSIFYQGLARIKLGREREAGEIFSRLVDYGQKHLNDTVKMDYFAVSLPDFLVFEVDLNERNRVHCHYMLALGELGLGHREAAREHFEAVLAVDPSHPGAVLHKQMSEEQWMK